MTEASYKKPPITEAIIDITFSKQLDDKKLESLNKKLSKAYPNAKKTQINSLELKLSPDGAVNQLPKKHEFEYSFASHDQTEAAVFVKSHFLISQRAPYQSWDVFIERFTNNWKLFRQAIGFAEIDRIGVRYINRLDIPAVDGVVEHEKYLNIYPNIPDSFGPVDAYATQTQFTLSSIGAILKINSAVVESPIPQHLSFIVDTDIISVKDTPQNDQDILTYLNKVRIEKNRIFEECVTDIARETFNNDP